MSKKLIQVLVLGILFFGIGEESYGSPSPQLACSDIIPVCIEKGCQGIREMQCPDEKCKALQDMVASEKFAKACITWDEKLAKKHSIGLECIFLTQYAMDHNLCKAPENPLANLIDEDTSSETH